MQALIAALLLSLAMHGVQWYWHDALQDEIKAERAAKVTVALAYSENARLVEAGWAKKVQGARDAKDSELRGVRARLDDALAGLRDRPDRRVPDPTPGAATACAGATGAELSGRDAAFLSRLSARADGLRAELAECYAREEALTVLRK